MATITRKEAEDRLAMPKLSLEEAEKMLDDRYDLVYVDYRDSLENPEHVASVIKTGYIEDMDFWPDDNRWEAAHEIMKETFNDYDIEDIEDDVRIAIEERDTSDPWRDLVKNTGNVVMYYKLGLECNGYGYHDEDLREILKMLRTNKKHESYDAISLMAGQASYGGELVIMFRADLEDFYGDPTKDSKYMRFIDPYIAVMDRWQGSGDFTQIKGTYSVPFDRERLRSDEAAPGYSLLGDVFGCSSDAVDCHYNFLDAVSGKLITPIGEAMSYNERKEIEYEKKWRETKECTFGDMRMSRHEETPYRNEFPCGSKCTKCGTFWID